MTDSLTGCDVGSQGQGVTAGGNKHGLGGKQGVTAGGNKHGEDGKQGVTAGGNKMVWVGNKA